MAGSMMAVAQHPFYLERQDQTVWYSNYNMSDYLCAYYQNNPNAVCLHTWDGAAHFGLAYPQTEVNSIDNKILYSLPGVMGTVGAPEKEVKFYLDKLRQENPDAIPRRISMILKIGGNHYSTLVIAPDRSNPDKSDIIYVNSFGDRSGYAQEDAAIIAAAKSAYPSRDSTVTVNTKRLQGNSPSCGVFALATVTQLNAAVDPRAVVMNHQLVDESQVTTLRREQGALLKDQPPELFVETGNQFLKALKQKLSENDFALLKADLPRLGIDPTHVEDFIRSQTHQFISALKTQWQITSLKQVSQEDLQEMKNMIVKGLDPLKTELSGAYLNKRNGAITNWAGTVVDSVIAEEMGRGGMNYRRQMDHGFER